VALVLSLILTCVAVVASQRGAFGLDVGDGQGTETHYSPSFCGSPQVCDANDAGTCYNADVSWVIDFGGQPYYNGGYAPSEPFLMTTHKAKNTSNMFVGTCQRHEGTSSGECISYERLICAKRNLYSTSCSDPVVATQLLYRTDVCKTP